MAETPVPLVCILGPTASGKTRLAVRVAAALGGEVISADSRQVYRGMDIGTGKDLGEYVVEGRPIPYHLIDIVDPVHEYNVFEFKRDCVAAIRDVHSRGYYPVLCGGTGLYLSAILQDYQLLPAPPDPVRRAALHALSTEQLIAKLRSYGPLHNTTDTRDRDRLVRAIEIAEAGSAAQAPSIALDARVFGVRWRRSELRQRITRRLAYRLDHGLIEEVRSLLEGGLSYDQLVFYGLEYRYVAEHLRGDISREEMITTLRSAIHQFAKRQDTWFRRMERQGVAIQWLDGKDPLQVNVDEITARTRHSH